MNDFERDLSSLIEQAQNVGYQQCTWDDGAGDISECKTLREELQLSIDNFVFLYDFSKRTD